MASNITPCVSHPSFLSHWAPNPSTERGDNLVLGTHPKEPKIIYPSGKFIVVRDVTNPTDVFVYRGHNSKTTVAKFSPNGFWVASADITGKVCIQLREESMHYRFGCLLRMFYIYEPKSQMATNVGHSSSCALSTF